MCQLIVVEGFMWSQRLCHLGRLLLGRDSQGKLVLGKDSLSITKTMFVHKDARGSRPP